MIPFLKFDGDGGLPTNLAADLDSLLRTRVLAQANSGGGKSTLLRSLLEQTHGKVLQIVLDPEGEFATLRERFPFVLAGGDQGDIPAYPKIAKLLATRILETRASTIIDLYDLPKPERREFVKLFLTALMAAPKTLWQPALVVIDEAHEFAPQTGESQATDAVNALCTQGRKRGFCAVLATQRISKLHKDAAAELLNKLVGRTGLDVDQKRAGDELGMEKAQRLALRDLKPGEFFVFGPAFGPGVTLARSASVLTGQATPGGPMAKLLPPGSVQDLLAKLGDLPAQAAAEEDRTVALERQVKELQGQLRQQKREQATPDVSIAEAYRSGQEEAEQRIAKIMNAEHEQAVTVMINEIHRRTDAACEHLLQANGFVTELRSTVLRQFAERAGQPSPVWAPPPPAQRTNVAVDIQIPPKRASVAPAARQAPLPGDAKVSGPQQRMLDAMARLETLGIFTPTRGHVAIWSQQSPKSSGFRANVTTLAGLQLIERMSGDRLVLTSPGREAAVYPQEPGTLEDLQQAWMAHVSGPQRAMLEKLRLRHPAPVEKADLAVATNQSPLSSGFRANITTLAGYGLVVRKPHDMLACGPTFFPEGLS